MRKYNQIHTLGTVHYKAHFWFLRKLKDCKCALWSEKCGSCPDLFAGNHWLSAHAKIYERMLVIEQFVGAIMEWYEYCALLDAVGILRILTKSTENLR